MKPLAYRLINALDTDLPLLILGTPLGTAGTVWASVAHRLREDFRVAITELPGHGIDAPNAPEDGVAARLTIDQIAQRTVAVADDLDAQTFFYAGCSISGGVAQVLALDYAQRLERVAALCTGPRFGDPDMWRNRIAAVRSEGPRALLAGTADRWFAAGFLEEDIAGGHMVLEDLAATPVESYVACCSALAAYDITDRLEKLATPILYVAGSQDFGNDPESMRQLALTVENGRRVVVPDAAHIVMVEHPEIVAEHLSRFFHTDD